ncbi:MAG: TIR domain-containing protein [Roseovarius sp.]|nr:TIR domain-containing protein [Roseovarius sp.]
MKKYNLFISHSWPCSDSYDKLLGLLDARPCFKYRNHSVPGNDPIHNAHSTVELKEAIREKMRHCNVVPILAGVYATCSKWINTDVDLAQSAFLHTKPIAAIEAWAGEKTSSRVKSAYDKIVRWSKDSVVNAIGELAN